LQGCTGPVDVVHATGGAIPPAGAAALVVTIHDLAPLHAPDWFTSRGVRLMSRAFDLARAEADMILVPSEATAAECRSRGIGDDRLRVVPWGVTPVAVDDATRAEVRARYDLPSEFALWVGTAEPRKNLDTLVTAAGRMESSLPLV
ncbi:MAG: glycosyltransferase family 4 protein, partial [Actinobacteria bacterium]|nr:glycosyltransferase family 4 protein [Actinomycetota bacterium]NIS30770.1 glycosyltransferase family 4 protein [Actinomycetota bacterium]NIT95286.1 glycosyltransferase family 4 protein [Actinomycetota bacterium]NIU18960.1 glycosyltransferase family 4 protein [Actinomycetota bacterium]NIU65983.1 glycosyltransferase family 4 protein [Actinomycetota bacterium]